MKQLLKEGALLLLLVLGGLLVMGASASVSNFIYIDF